MDASAVKNKSSSAKRMKKLRSKKKLEDPDFQKKENRRISELKKKMKMCMNEKRKLLLRRYERDRKREQRARKKQNINSTCSPKKNAVESPYGSSQSLGTIVQSAKDFAQLAQELVPSTQSVFISEDEIRRVIDEEKPWEGVIPVPGISSYHVIEVKPNNEVFKHHAMTNDQKDLNNPAQSGSDLDIIKGDWCLVMYNGFCYPGILEEICEDEVKVNVMVPATKQHYKWPNPRDCISYLERSCIL